MATRGLTFPPSPHAVYTLWSATPIAQPEDGKTVLPGFGRPMNYTPQEGDRDCIRKRFPSALSQVDMDCWRTVMPMTTLRELSMLHLMNSITDEPEWYTKINNPEMVQKWREEALVSGQDITQSMLDWCVAELQHNASKLPPDSAQCPPTFVYDGDVYKSDVAISPELKLTLQEAVKAFEAKIPQRQKDMHPESDEKVWNLVDPSLFPLIYERTRVLPNGETTTLGDCIERSGEGEVVHVLGAAEMMEWEAERFSWIEPISPRPYSARFQWLPCEVDISGEEAKITSYINNLHPEEKPLYTVIEKLITASIPLWDRSLAPLSKDGFMRKRERRIPFGEVKYDPADPENLPPTEGPQQQQGEDDNVYHQRRWEWIEATRAENLVVSEPGEFSPFEEAPKFGLREVYGSRGRGLQVIVKLANIELTPEKPRYEGESWHVEGQMNEHIVATALYYYSNENITPSDLSFRAQVDQEVLTYDINYAENDHGWLRTVFGCQQGEAAVQELGSVEAREGRLVTFTNILQHRMGPFELEDKGRRGHCKIVALFLVDPGVRVISTAHVPCQQQAWWWKAAQAVNLEGTKGPGSSRAEAVQGIAALPLELQYHVLEGVDFPISLQEAKRLRLELWQERKEFVVQSGKLFESKTFLLYEPL